MFDIITKFHKTYLITKFNINYAIVLGGLNLSHQTTVGVSAGQKSENPPDFLFRGVFGRVQNRKPPQILNQEVLGGYKIRKTFVLKRIFYRLMPLIHHAKGQNPLFSPRKLGQNLGESKSSIFDFIPQKGNRVVKFLSKAQKPPK